MEPAIGKFENAEGLHYQKLESKEFLISQKLTYIDSRHCETCALRVLNIFTGICKNLFAALDKRLNLSDYI